jgi:hypothetical protein
MVAALLHGMPLQEAFAQGLGTLINITQQHALLQAVHLHMLMGLVLCSAMACASCLHLGGTVDTSTNQCTVHFPQ